MNSSGLLIFVIVVLAIAALVGNIELIALLFGSELPDGQVVLIIIAIIADIILFVLAVRRFKEYLKKKDQDGLTQKKLRVKELIDEEIGKKQAVINLVADYEKRYRSISHLLRLLSYANDASDKSLNQIDSYFNDSYEKSLPELISQLPKNERQRFPSNYHEIQSYRKTLSNELSELYRKTRDVDSATTKEEFKNTIGKDFKSATSKIDFKKRSRITIIVISGVLVASIIVGIGLYFSPGFTFYLAKQDFEKNSNIDSMIDDNGLGDITIVETTYYEFESYSKEKLFWYSIVAENNAISEYYTQIEDSQEAKELLSIMKSIDSELSSQSYTYHHSNGWNVKFEFDQFTIKDSNGHTYKYESYDDGFYYLQIDSKYVIYHLGSGY